MLLLQPGDPAPDFSAVTQDGERVQLSDFRGRSNVVLYFYPKDFTRGCTAQACSFRDHYGRLSIHNAVIFGVSRDDGSSHRKFSSLHRLPFPLLTDATGSIAKSYGAARMLGPVKRVTFVIDRDGIIRDVQHHEFAIGSHVERVITALERISKSKTP